VKVVVIGAGFAGLAAAIALQEKRHEVTLLERRGVLGGRATSYRDALSGEDVDNGSHLMVGAYRDALDLIRRAGGAELLLEQEDLTIDYVEDAGPTVLRCPPLPAPLHLLAGLLGLRLPWPVRFQALRLGLAVRFGAPPIGLTLAEYFRRTGQGPEARRLLWDPLAIAIVNEAPERAAAILFHRVYQEAFLASRKASRLVFLRCGWGAVAECLARYFEARGGTLHRRALVRAIGIDGPQASGVSFTQRAEEKADIQAGRRAREERLEADAVVAAVPWHVLPGLLPEGVRSKPPFAGLADIRSSPIVSVELWLDRVVVGPVLVGLRDSEVEWVFDKGRLYGRSGAPQHLSFIVSAAYRSSPKPNAELLAAAVAALRRYFPAMASATVTRSLVMREPEATFSAGPETESLRPPSVTPVGGLFLAGDWTATGLPATIEGAVRSGREAARVLQSSER
jgi:hydroxysqualene dehydroxylase